MPKRNVFTFQQKLSEGTKRKDPRVASLETTPLDFITLTTLWLALLPKVGNATNNTYYIISAKNVHSREPSYSDLPYYGMLVFNMLVTQMDNSTGTPIVGNQTIVPYQHMIATETHQQEHVQRTTIGTGKNKRTVVEVYYTTENKASLLYMNDFFNCFSANAVSAAFLPVAAHLFTTVYELASSVALNVPMKQDAKLVGNISNIPASAFPFAKNTTLNLFNHCVDVALAAEARRVLIALAALAGLVMIFAIPYVCSKLKCNQTRASQDLDAQAAAGAAHENDAAIDTTEVGVEIAEGGLHIPAERDAVAVVISEQIREATVSPAVFRARMPVNSAEDTAIVYSSTSSAFSNS